MFPSSSPLSTNLHYSISIHLRPSVDTKHEVCSPLNNGVLPLAMFPTNILALLQALPLTSTVYLGQVKISVSAGNLYNYITQLPNLLL
jgi:hypothetical protein